MCSGIDDIGGIVHCCSIWIWIRPFTLNFQGNRSLRMRGRLTPESLESKWSFILPIAIAWLAMVTTIAQAIIYTLTLNDSINWQEWEVFQPWAAFESIYLIYKILEGFTMWKRYGEEEEPHRFGKVYHLLKWSVVRIALVSALALYPEIISAHILVLPSILPS